MRAAIRDKMSPCEILLVAEAEFPQHSRKQLATWIERFFRARTDEIAEVDRLIPWLSAEIPDSPPPTMIHNDYKLNNVLLDSTDPTRLTAVLDWEMATVGDPLSDIASLLVYWTEPGEAEMMGGLRSVSALPGFPSRAEIARMYADLSGRDLSAIDWYVANVKNDRVPDLKYAAAVIVLRYRDWPGARERLGAITEKYCGTKADVGFKAYERR